MKKLALLIACGMIFAYGNAQDAKALMGDAQKAYNEYLLKASTGALDENAVSALEKSFNLYQEVLAVDTVFEKEKDGSPKLDKKTGLPKFKTKFSGDAQKALVQMATQQDFLIAGEFFREKEDFKNAASYYSKNTKLLKSPQFGKNVADSVLATSLFLQGFANYFCGDFENSLTELIEAKGYGYNENNIDGFIADIPQRLVSAYIEKEDYAGADAVLDKLLNKLPNNSSILTLKARVLDIENGLTPEVEQAYNKAIEVDPENAFAYYCLGIGYSNKVYEAIQSSNAMTDAQLAKDIAPYLDKPIEYLNKALQFATGRLDDATIDDAKSKLDALNKYKNM